MGGMEMTGKDSRKQLDRAKRPLTIKERKERRKRRKAKRKLKRGEYFEV